jgi:hypothetical protein
METYKVTLNEEEHDKLRAITSTGAHRTQKILNALILLNCDEGEHGEGKTTNEKIAGVLKVSMKKIDRVKKRFVEEGLDVALGGHKSIRVYDRKADGEFEAHLIALSCGEPPEGFERWSLRLLAEKAVELDYIDSVSYETVRRVLKKTKQNPGRSRGG